MPVTVRQASDVPWDDVRTVFGTKGDPAGCWCQWFKITGAEWKTRTPGEMEQGLCDQVRDTVPSPGLVAYLDGEPVGWCAVEARPRYRRLNHLKVAAASELPQGDPNVWAITCFVVRVGYRKRGVSTALLSAAVEHARAHGARVLEAYPVDAAGGTVPSGELFHGVLSSFIAAGFDVAARPTPGRAVVQLTL